MTCPEPLNVVRTHRSSTALLIAMLAGLALGGCDDRSPAEKALVQSSREINSISGGPGVSEPSIAAQKRKAAASAISEVPANSSVELAATMSTLAQTQLGQSMTMKADVVMLERDGLAKEAKVRGLLGEWASLASLASSIESFDPVLAIKDLDESIAGKQKEAADYGSRKKELDEKIASLKSKADAANAQGDAAEAEYAKLRERAQSLNAVQAEPLITEAAKFKRTSDEAHIQAARYLAEADVMSPESAEAAQGVERTANQIRGLQEAKKRLQDRRAQASTEGQAVRAQAEQIARDLDSAVQDFRAHRSGPVDAAYGALAKAYMTAASTAKKATDDKGGGSKMALGVAQQALGDLYWDRAKGEQKFALLMDRIVNVSPELAKKSEYADVAKAALEAKKSALEQAKSAYEGAVSAYRAGGAKGQVKEQLDLVIKRLEAFATAAGDDKVDVLEVLAAGAKPAEEAAPAQAEPAEKPAETAASSETAAAPSAGGRPLSQAPEVLQQNLEKFSTAARNGDASELRDVLLIPAEQAEQMNQLLKIQEAQGNLERACRRKFQKGLADAMQGMGGGMGAGALNVNGELDLANATFTMPSEDTAVVTVPGLPQALTWKLIDNDWKMELGLDKLPAGTLNAIVKLADPLSAAFNEVANDVKADKLQTIQAVGVALMQKLGPIIQQMQQGGPGGG